MDFLSKLENESIYLIREAYSQIRNIAVLWSIGKDSTTLLHLIRKAFYGWIPFQVIHIDTGYKFKEIYQFRDHYAREWGLNLVVYQNKEARAKGVCPQKDILECCTELKTNALKDAVKRENLNALFLGIRRDEHGIRAKERFFSLRDNDFEWDYIHQAPELWNQYKTSMDKNEHLRIHPLLSWTELDIWKYIERENIPVTSLYFAHNNKRYRSIGCEVCCHPMESSASTISEIITEIQTTKLTERSGRTQDKESDFMMQKLRSLGYM